MKMVMCCSCGYCGKSPFDYCPNCGSYLIETNVKKLICSWWQ